MSKEIVLISLEQSKHKAELINIGGNCVTCPIGKIDDIEVIFLHAHSQKEAIQKWNRRKMRINYNNLIFKFSEMNGCTKDDLVQFDNFKTSKKIVFVTKDYKLKNQVIVSDYIANGQINNDTLTFRKNINLIELVKGHSFYK